MEMNKIIWILGIPTEGRSIGTDTVTLSPSLPLRVNSAKGLSRWAARCFAALSMTVLSSIRMSRLLCSFALRDWEKTPPRLAKKLSGREEAYLRSCLLWPHKCYEYHATDQEQQSSQQVRAV